MALTAHGEGWEARLDGPEGRVRREAVLALSLEALESLGRFRDRVPPLELSGELLLAGGQPLGPAVPLGDPGKACAPGYPKDPGPVLALRLMELSKEHLALLLRLNRRSPVRLEVGGTRLQATGPGWSVPLGGPPTRPTALARAVQEGPTRGPFPVARGLLGLLETGPVLVALEERERARFLRIMGEKESLVVWQTA